MSDIRVKRLAFDEPTNWPAHLTGPAAFTSLDSWSQAIRSTYHFQVFRFETEIEGHVNGILALTHIQHPIFGNYLATSPFGSYGGFAFSGEESRDLLLNETRLLASELAVDYVNIRWAGNPAGEPAPDGWIQHAVYATFRMDLSPNPETLMSDFSSDHRNHIRKSLKKGFFIKFGGRDLIIDAYEALSRSMHELGSPYHSRKYLENLVDLLGDTLEFAVLYTADGKLAGAGVFILQGKTATNLHANILRAHRSDYAGEYLYWKVIEHYCLQGYNIFDLGRSLLGSGNETFKMKWKPRKEMLAYWYALKPGTELPSLNQKNPKFAIAIRIWKKLPPFIVRPLGAILISGLA